MRNLEARAPYGERARVVGHDEPAAQRVPFASVTPCQVFLVLRRIVRHPSPGQKHFFSSGRESP